MQVKGTLLKVLDQETISDKFSKRTIVVRTKEEYPQEIPVEFVNDKIKLIESFKEGEDVDVAINLRGREWKGKWFPSVNGWKISGLVSEVTSSTQSPDREDLPF
tara:strand:+ start:1703 stop:2014 length:312 start_codon:yes stop_codon:yes gene_type:complete